MRRLLGGLVLFIFFSQPLFAAKFDYGLNAKPVADNTYLFIGKKEDFNFQNGGNIVNSGFIITDEGVVVIDTGSSRRYGEQMLAEIRKQTNKPIFKVINTHHHPDHFLGNQAFKPAPIAALKGTVKGIKNSGDMFAENLYRMTGDWMRGTEAVVPDITLQPGIEEIGGHELEYIELSGHTGSDLAVFDRTTGVLFAGDLVFHNRTLTTPHAIPEKWFVALDKLAKLPFKVLIPGHGEPVSDLSAIEQTRDYLRWLVTTLENGANKGLSMNEVMQTEIPARFAGLALVKSELNRSVVHLYPGIEKKTLHKLN
ncbi:MAG: quinoprotein relay system zinc metallohydrolase 1 [Gammaproteobacteria bacterium]|nr:MAG: quinoprotein relay system zinc metallohydrolase 1 [Gammaproteobacteria bacterium]